LLHKKSVHTFRFFRLPFFEVGHFCWGVRPFFFFSFFFGLGSRSRFDPTPCRGAGPFLRTNFFVLFPPSVRILICRYFRVRFFSPFFLSDFHVGLPSPLSIRYSAPVLWGSQRRGFFPVPRLRSPMSIFDAYPSPPFAVFLSFTSPPFTQAMICFFRKHATLFPASKSPREVFDFVSLSHICSSLLGALRQSVWWAL